MTGIAFIGLGNMGAPMARNLMKAGHRLALFDQSAAAAAKLSEPGVRAAGSVADAVKGAEVVISMLPAGEHVTAVYLEKGGAIESAAKGALLLDCSTIDVTTARRVHEAAAAKGLQMLDAPVSGGVGGAEAASLTFMAGGSEAAFERARPILSAMGKTVVHAGGPGNGQAAKICNNLMLGISMIGTCEAFVLAEKLGLAPEKLFEISSRSSGQSWSLTSYCPVPGPLPTSPANRDYKPGFTGSMMLKDLRLAQEAASAARIPSPLGAQAMQIYQLMETAGEGGADFSGVIRLLRKR
jgi:3-hydroxyisobutyrate dehydrogenase